MGWFGGKPKNRRLGRTHVLDVKLRSDQVRASRMRMGAVALAITFSTIFLFFAIWRSGEFALDRLIYKNKSFAVQDIEVKTDGVLAREQLKRWAGVRLGENLLALDLARVKRDLEMVSLIKSVAVERVLPHTLRLRVTERDPLAQVYILQTATDGKATLAVVHLDADGFVMAPIEPGQRATPVTQTNDILPVIAGLKPADLGAGRRVDSAQARAALQLISAFERSPMAGLVDLRTIDVSSPQILQVTTGQGCMVVFAVEDLDAQLRRWRAIQDRAVQLGKAISSLDLSVHSNPPMRLIEASLAPQYVPKARKSSNKRQT